MRFLVFSFCLAAVHNVWRQLLSVQGHPIPRTHGSHSMTLTSRARFRCLATRRGGAQRRVGCHRRAGPDMDDSAHHACRLPSGGSAPSSLAGFVEEVVVVCGCGVSVFCCAKYTDTLATILPPVCIMPIKCRHELLQSSLAFLRCHCCMLVLDTVFGRYIVAACACPPEDVSVCATRQRELGPWWFCWVWGGARAHKRLCE